MNKILRIGTRDSALALWQARTVADQLEAIGCKTTLVPIKSDGDKMPDQPIYTLGITGVFTKTLDAALLSGKIDIAVHSMKDVPTTLAEGIVQAAVLERANPLDVVVHKPNFSFTQAQAIVATGSLRRTAQWLHQYPTHQVVDLRGNINTRLQKLKDQPWDAALFAAAGLDRLNIQPENCVTLDWMIPAPAQGAVVVVTSENNYEIMEALASINHLETEITTYIERQFLKTLEGGCSAPIGAWANYDETTDTIHFKGVLLSVDGSKKINIEKSVPINEWKKLGFFAAKEILDQGGTALMKELAQNSTNK